MIYECRVMSFEYCCQFECFSTQLENVSRTVDVTSKFWVQSSECRVQSFDRMSHWAQSKCRKR